MKLTVLLLAALVLGSAALPHAVSADDFRYGPDTCRNGYVWREASPADRVCVRPASRSLVARENAAAFTRIDAAGAYGPFTCVAGFVWREAFHGDMVCVSPDRRSAVGRENAAAHLHRSRG